MAYGDYADANDTTFGGAGRRAAPSAHLDDVFDDPEHGEPGRDRLGIHVVWELLLLLGVGAIGFLLWRGHEAAFRGVELKTLLVTMAALGFITLGAGLSLRVAAPNLAVGPVAIAASIFFAKEGDRGVVGTTGVVAVFALGLGIALAILVVGFHVPGWAAGLAAAFVAIVYIQKHSGPVAVTGGYNPIRHAYYLAGAFVALAILGGLVGSIKSVRRAVGRFRPVADPARRRGGVAAGLTAASLILSTVLAAVGGILLAALDGALNRQVLPLSGLEYTGLAIGAALLGGTSAFGRRGGIFGTLFAVVLVVLFIRYDEAENWRISVYALAAALVAGGLIVTRLVETMGRPLSYRDGDDEDSDDTWVTSGGTQPLTGAGASWTPPRQDSWSSSLPAQPSTGRTSDLWSDDRWGSRSSS